MWSDPYAVIDQGRLAMLLKWGMDVLKLKGTQSQSTSLTCDYDDYSENPLDLKKETHVIEEVTLLNKIIQVLAKIVEKREGHLEYSPK